jgi:cardiolipin synthase
MTVVGLDPLALAYLVLEWTIRIGMLIVIPFRRSPDAARNWLLVGFFLPVPALLLYLMIGRPTYPRWRQRRAVDARRLLGNARDEIAHSRHCTQPKLPDTLTPSALLIEHLGQFPALGGNKVDLIVDYEAVINAIVADIDRASRHVHILTYIFADDRTGGRIIDALGRAVARGVACRVLIDALGSHTWAKQVMRRLKANGVEAQQALPITFLRLKSARADLRNHRKITVIDGHVGYIGSQNLVDADFAKNKVNHELVVRACGAVVLELQAIFAADWFLEAGESLNARDLFPHRPAEGKAVAQVLPSGPDYPLAGAGQLVTAMIAGARHRVVITTPYFIPDEPLLKVMQTAVLRGVEVVLLVSAVTDHLFVSLAEQSYYDQLLQAGIEIYRFRDGLLHAKHLSIDDDISFVGSSNMDIRSFLLNSEASLVLFDRIAITSLQAEQRRIMAASDRLSLAQWKTRPPLKKVAENVARLVSPLL